MTILPGDLSFCASGEANRDGVCISRTNVGTSPFPCNDDNACKYTNSLNSTDTDPNACACSKGSKFLQFCPLGSGNQQYKNYISQYITYLSKFGPNKCHTVERSSCPLVNKADTNSYSVFYSSQIMAKNFHILNDAEDCVKKVIYPGLISSSPNDTCPQVTCNKLVAPSCADFTINNNSQRGSFVGQSCDSSTRCSVDKSIFDSLVPATASCVNRTHDSTR